VDFVTVFFTFADDVTEARFIAANSAVLRANVKNIGKPKKDIG
jgi:hypothetical protein